MKKLFLKRETAITVLIIIALAAIPVFGGMKLNAAYERTFVSFEKDGRQVDKYGNSLVSDIEQCAAAAGDVLALAKPYIEAKPQLYETAEKALAELNSAESVFERYEAYGRVIATLKPVYELALDAGAEGTIETRYAVVLDRSAIIARGYESKYREAALKAEELVSGFPAKQLAALFGIGR